MDRDALNDLAAFAVVAEELSFTRAAARLGMSASALSHAMRTLETRLGIRLLARTTRRVAPTEAGERLLRTLRPALADITAELAALAGLRDKPAGNLRLTMPKHAAVAVLSPMLPAFLADYPDIRVEITVDEGLTDIVASRYDAGLRFGENVAKDMVAIRVGAPIHSAVVATPGYFAAHLPPATPHDLARHRCINYRLVTAGRIYPWEFEKDGQTLQVAVEGPLIFNDSDLILTAVLAGQGVAQLLDDQVADHVAAGRLIRVLEAWRWTAPGYYLYHTSRRQTPPPLAALIRALGAIGAAPRR
jgi:DNA-binding transcriptional LysR family regulator